MSDTTDILFAGDEEGTKAVFARWFKQVGDAIEANEPVAEVETDKVMLEVVAPASGSLAEQVAAEGDALEPGMVVGRLTAGSVAPTTETESSDPEKRVDSQPATAVTAPGDATSRMLLSPAVRRLVHEHELDVALVPGSGRGGRITVGDIKTYLKSPRPLPAAPAPVAPARPAPSVPMPDMSEYDSHRAPHDNMRKRIAEHMVTRLLHTAPPRPPTAVRYVSRSPPSWRNSWCHFQHHS